MSILVSGQTLNHGQDLFTNLLHELNFLKLL